MAVDVKVHKYLKYFCVKNRYNMIKTSGSFDSSQA